MKPGSKYPHLIPSEKLIVFDLDETLIKSVSVKNTKNLDFRSVTLSRGKYFNAHFSQSHKPEEQFFAFIRPHLDYVLEDLSKHFELALVSLAELRYVEQVLNIIDPESKYFSHVLAREDALFNASNKSLQKNIALFARDPKDIIVIDNKEFDVSQMENVLPISDYNCEDKDLALLSLSQYLMTFLDV